MKRNLFYVAAFALTLLSCSQEDLTNKSGKDGVKQGVPFVGTSKVVTGENPASRTSLDYDRTARSMTYYWEPGDKLWLDDGNSAEGEITAKVASATFFLSGTYNAQNYTVYYPGKNATTYNGVTIQTAQTQTAPNSSSHIGEAGDCGVATANKKPSGGYSFSLDHKASYLCFLPRTTNVTETGWVLTSIKVTSNDNIAGSYTLSTTGLSGTGSSNEITLTVSNFDITNSETSQATNASYMVIAPGTHTLKVEYSVKNTVSGNTGTIVRNLDAKTYAANTLYPITANLFGEYSNTKYYLWDAEQDLWYNKTAVDYANGLYSASDNPQRDPGGSRYSVPADQYRWFNTNPPEVPGFTMQHGYGNKFYYATRSAKDCPSVFELAWYYDKGDVRWDATGAFLFRGKIYYGGAWIKKQSVIAQENSTTVAALKNTYPGPHDGNENDLIHPDAGMAMGPEKAIGQGAPSSSTIKKYFFLPALGDYGGTGTGYAIPDNWNTLSGLATHGHYTCSNTYDNSQGLYVWSLRFDNAKVYLYSTEALTNGLPLWKAQ